MDVTTNAGDVRLAEQFHSIEDFLSCFTGVKPSSQDQWLALCPAHSDHEPSLSIKLADRKILVNCLAGCSPNAIMQAVNLTMSHLYLNGHGPAKVDTRKTIERTYDYQDSNGKVLFQVVRFVPKSFAQRHPDGNGGWIWGLKGVKPVGGQCFK